MDVTDLVGDFADVADVIRVVVDEAFLKINLKL